MTLETTDRPKNMNRKEKTARVVSGRSRGAERAAFSPAGLARVQTVYLVSSAETRHLLHLKEKVTFRSSENA